MGLMRAYKDARIAHCQSDIVARMDAYNVMYPERLEKQLHILHANPEITLCVTQARNFPEEMVRAGYVMGENYLDVA